MTDAAGKFSPTGELPGRETYPRGCFAAFRVRLSARGVGRKCLIRDVAGGGTFKWAGPDVEVTAWGRRGRRRTDWGEWLAFELGGRLYLVKRKGGRVVAGPVGPAVKGEEAARELGVSGGLMAGAEKGRKTARGKEGKKNRLRPSVARKRKLNRMKSWHRRKKKEKDKEKWAKIAEERKRKNAERRTAKKKEQGPASE